MRKIPFKVSARTAKLIGQENFSNAEGATIELVKNSYDADATHCLVIFDIIYPDIPETLTTAAYKRLIKDPLFQQSWYKPSGERYALSVAAAAAKLKQARDFFFAQNAIYIIDNGTGMDENTILNQWMEIGTGNKELKFQSDKSERIKTGAKGIGRFALDRLGRLSEMYTFSRDDAMKKGFFWKMDWRQFEQPHRALTDIQAELLETDFRLIDYLEKEFHEHTSILNLFKSKVFAGGTVIKISQLKDVWDLSALIGMFKNLEALVPPKGSGINFELNFFHLQEPKEYGPVETAYFNDFDYKISGKFNAETLKITCALSRNELDLKAVKKKYPRIFRSAKKPFDLATIQKGQFSTIGTVNEFLKWEENRKNKALLKRVGNFSFTFYFIKRTRAGKDDYPYKDFNARERAATLDRWGGIKIYRDSFRVRPYGENGNDWLRLGERASQSPAGAGQRIGDWRVGPNQMAGSIHISRIANPEIIDKSDRGSLVENEIFDQFTKIVLGVIAYFEIDRSTILHPIYLENKRREEQQREEKIKKEAERLAVELVKKQNKLTKAKRVGRAAPQKLVVEEEIQAYQTVIRKQLEQLSPRSDDQAEIAQIRGLAGLGLIVASFSHELKEVRNNATELETLENRYHTLVPVEKHQSRLFRDGVNILKTLIRDRQRMSHWIDYALTAIKSDKRKRETIKFGPYFTSLKNTWKFALDQRRIFLHTDDNIDQTYDFRAFEVDMDTIFSNLISNSIDAFNNLRTTRERNIFISARLNDENIQIEYADTGEGLNKIFHKNREEIFLPFVTSKKDANGNNLGTGLGMYLVKTIVTDYKGEIKLSDPKIGFKLTIDLPLRKPK